ncbi:MAG: chorion class high-cysteine HCB protein 13 [Clostridiales bacterium]|nr:chorion class high-cysteine HCB protein 13 [Clostridiales bacterium]
MSDLAATNCGCECGNGGNSCCNLLWLILILCSCRNGCEHNCGPSFGGGCDWIWIILLLSFCGGGCGGGCGNGGFC